MTNADDADVQAMVASVAGHALPRSRSRRREPTRYYDRARRQLVVLGEPLITRDELPLLGDHNVANALAAALAVMVADAQHRTTARSSAIADGAAQSFRALEHRIETGRRPSTASTWINDSKSTNVASTLVAMRGMTRPTVLLLGGRHKGEPYTALAPSCSARSRRDRLRRGGADSSSTTSAAWCPLSGSDRRSTK